LPSSGSWLATTGNPEQIKMIGPDVHHLAPFGMPAIASIPIG
jgi:hypothetical protein